MRDTEAVIQVGDKFRVTAYGTRRYQIEGIRDNNWWISWNPGDGKLEFMSIFSKTDRYIQVKDE